MDSTTDEARIRNAPQHVKSVSQYAFLLAILAFIKPLCFAWANHSPLSKALLGGAVAAVAFFANGGGMFNRSKFSYYALFILGVLFVFGGLASGLHLLALSLASGWRVPFYELLRSLFGVCQLVLAVCLLRHLLTGETRSYMGLARSGLPSSVLAAD